MTLGELVAAARTLAPDASAAVEAAGQAATEVTGVTHDSRSVTPGSVFVAIKGQQADGAEFAADAVARGAVAVVAEGSMTSVGAAPWLVADSARSALAELSAIVHGRPSDDLLVVGVTGTNGKTTTTYLMASVFDAAGLPCGRLGTVSIRVGASAGFERDASHTTPEASDLQGLLREMVTNGCRACAMEASSHALVLDRVAELRFSAAIFTNLTRDHLDFHGDMSRYFAAKRRLFDLLPDGAPAIVNIDDPRGEVLASAMNPVVTYAIDRPADVRAQALHSTLEGLAFEIDTPRGPIAIRSPLVGRPNAYNILGVVATAIALGLPTESIEQGITALECVPGRFQQVSGSTDDVRVVVDYAHTDDALKNVLETARALNPHRLISVFGCGGDRDRTKRPLMGAVAARLSDVVVLTSDNPRSEEPVRIIEDISRGLKPTSNPEEPRHETVQVLTVPDRRQAVEQAIRDAEPGDLVVIAGKGHEKYQVVGDRTLPFDDVEVARTALGQRRAASQV
jgi:UDP-N-acetylmuramoyl-L-alanyl-D-glutamate--2,6-diaminopimelate ligase